MSERIASRGQRQRFPRPIYDRAEELLNQPGGRPTAAAIANQLGLEFEDQAPQPRTIGDWIRNGIIALSAPADPWSMESGSPDDAVLVLPAIREAIDRSNGFLSGLTTEEARWVVRIRKAAPTIPIASAFMRAQAMARVPARRQGEAIRDLEIFLAYAPWDDGAAAYTEAFTAGRIPTFVLDPSTNEGHRTGFPAAQSLGKPGPESGKGDMEPW